MAYAEFIQECRTKVHICLLKKCPDSKYIHYYRKIKQLFTLHNHSNLIINTKHIQNPLE